LADMKDRWEDLVAALQDFVNEGQAGRQADDTGLDPETQAPVPRRSEAGGRRLRRDRGEEAAQSVPGDRGPGGPHPSGDPHGGDEKRVSGASSLRVTQRLSKGSEGSLHSTATPFRLRASGL
jgi:hypothetical protein